MRVENVVSELSKVADDAKSAFGGFSVEQLNWKPDEKSWSVAQCFDHLIVMHTLYFPIFDKLIAGDAKPTFWERYSPLSGFFGGFLIKNLDPKNLKKMRTTAKAFPSASAIGGDIIERFGDHQRQFAEYVQRLPAGIDPAKTIITSPLLGIVTYSLEDSLIFVPMHCQRHFDQAKRVTETDGFPK